MENRKIVIAGGTGFIGKYIGERFKKQGYDIIIISRQPQHVQWEDKKAIINALENSLMLINLAGKSVDCRYNEKNKQEILRSRTETTKTLGEAVYACNTPPGLWINSGTATIYRHSEDMPMTEDAGEIGTGFSVDVAINWEKAFFHFQLPKTRQVVLRIAIVLGKDGGVIKPFLNLVRFGLGGKQGKGNQMFSWIHIEDLFNVISFIQSNKNLTGVFNCSSPYPVDNKTLMKIFRQSMHVKIALPSPKWLLKVGAVIIKTEPELILKSRWVLPAKLIEAGFKFKYPKLPDAVKEIVGHTHSV